MVGRTSLVAQMVKRLSTMWETRARSLGQEDPLEKEMATDSNTLAWRIPWREEPVHGVAKSQTRLSDLVTDLCPALCDPMDCSLPGFSVLHHLPEFAQTHVH